MAKHNKKMSKSIDWEGSESQQKQSKQKTQFEQNNQSDKRYTLAEKVEFKKSGALPLGFNEHTKVLRTCNLTTFSDDQLVKSIIYA